MKKKEKALFLFLLLVIPASIAYFKNAMVKAADQLDAMSKHGFEISIVTYDGNGEPTIVGKPILVYEKGLLDTVTKTIKGSYPTGTGPAAHAQMNSTAYPGLIQFVDENNPNTTVESTEVVDPSTASFMDPQMRARYENANGANTKDDELSARSQEVKKEVESTTPNGFIMAINALDESGLGLTDLQVELADVSSNIFIFDRDSEALGIISGVLLGNYQNFLGGIINPGNIDSFLNSDIYGDIFNKYLGFSKSAELELGNAVADSMDGTKHNLFERTLDQGSGCPANYRKEDFFPGEANVDTEIRRYMSTERTVIYPQYMMNLNKYYAIYEDSGTVDEIHEKYASTVPLIEENFGIKINPNDLDKYFVQIDVVQRTLEYDKDKQIVVGQTVVHTILDDTFKPTKWGTSIGSGGFFGAYNSLTTGYSNWVLSGHGCNDGEGTYNSDSGKCEKTYCPSTCTDCDANCTSPKTCTSTYEANSCNTGDTQGKVVGSNKNGTIYECKHSYSCRTDPKWETDINDAYELYTVYPCKKGLYFQDIIYGSVRMGPSYITKSRYYNGPDANPSYFYNFATNSCADEEAKHCIMDDNTQECTGKYLYYKGANLESALVGPSSVDPSDSKVNGRNYLYTMSNSYWDDSKKEYVCSGGAEGTGVKHYFFIDTPEPVCQIVCSRVGPNTSDEYLKCAENYCDAQIHYDTNGNSRKRKKECLIEDNYRSCNYWYGHNPGQPDSESVDSCNQSQIVKNFGTTKSLNLTSTCNVLENGKYVPESKGTYVEECFGDGVTDYDGKDENDKTFDQRSYLNKICKETVSFNFKDTSVLSLTKGSGFTYPIVQEGERTCTYFINKEQWKFDYASVPSGTPELRKRMMYLLDSYNNQILTPVQIKGDNYEPIFLEDGSGKTGFEIEGYNFSKTTVGTKIKEVMATGETESITKNMVVSDKTEMSSLTETAGVDALNSKATDLSNMTKANLMTVANETVTIIANGTIGTRGINRYASEGTGKVTYGFEKVCVSTDGQATVSGAPDNGVCYQTKIENKLIDVLAEDKHYTSFKISTTDKHNIETTVSVGNSGSSDTTKYYSDAEKCTYKIKDNDLYKCEILVDIQEGGIKYGNNQYQGTLKATIHYAIDQSEIQKVAIDDNGHETTAEEITISNRNNRSMEVHAIEGRVYLKNGQVVRCPETVDLYGGTSCGVACDIEKVEETVYEIKSTGVTQATDYYSYRSSHSIPSLSVLSQENSLPYEFMKPVYGAVTDGRRYVRLSEKIEDEEILFGYVTTGGNGSCNNYCHTPLPDYGNRDCYRLYKPAETEDIHNYCYSKWDDDVNGFVSDEDCYNKCTAKVCPNNRNNLIVVENHCANYNALGFPDYEHCMNKCYKEENDDGTGDYLYRSVNVLDPFPSSQESQGIFEKGDRVVGKNWKFLSGYITDDSQDRTSVTGEYANTQVEYVIDLSAGDVKDLRYNTNENRKTVYSTLNRITGDKNIVQEYRSEFLHKSDFSRAFQTGHGSIQASFNPSQN